MVQGRHSIQPNSSARRNTSSARLPRQQSAYQAKRTAEDRKKRFGKQPRKNHAVRSVAILIVAVVIAALVFFFVANHRGPVQEGKEIEVTIAEGSTANQIGKLLEEKGVIASSSDFTKAVKEKDAASSLKPGTYHLIGGTDAGEIVDILISGKTGYSLTIPEGYSLSQIAKTVEQTCGIDADAFEQQATVANYKANYAFLDEATEATLEGYLFPDTYSISYTDDADAIIRQMLDDYETRMGNVDLSAAQQNNLDSYGVLTLASIIEKESHDDSDKATIASVFLNRMNADMNLGSDVTTYYAVGKDLTDELTSDDLGSTNPYNTRNPLSRGLPPGPICSPSMASIQAAAAPADTNYLYFFYSNSEEKVMYFETADDFNKAWAEYGDR